MQTPSENPAFHSIASGSLNNKIFPPEREVLSQLISGINAWTKHQGLPTLPRRYITSV